MRERHTKVKPQPNRVLKALRAELGLTQAEFGARLGYVRVAYVAVENGRKRPSLDTFERIWRQYKAELEQLGVEFEDLCRGRAA